MPIARASARLMSTLASERRHFGTIVSVAYKLVRAKHSKHFSLVDAISVAMDRMQRNFEPMRRQVEGGRQIHLTERPSEAN